MVSKKLSVCLSFTNFDPNYLGTGRTEWAEIFLGHFRKNDDLSSNQKPKTIWKKFATLAAPAVFVSSFLLQKQLIYDFQHKNNHSDLHHLQGVWSLPHKFHLYLIQTIQKTSNKWLWDVLEYFAWIEIAAVLIISSMGLMYWSDWFWGWENRFYSIGMFCGGCGQFVVVRLACMQACSMMHRPMCQPSLPVNPKPQSDPN